MERGQQGLVVPVLLEEADSKCEVPINIVLLLKFSLLEKKTKLVVKACRCAPVSSGKQCRKTEFPKITSIKDISKWCPLMIVVQITDWCINLYNIKII